ncbi:MAG TPA: DHA2 family efflux MFS transporter permease subunit [Rhodocyclaceae bacterium]|nr:DHA2 family efflux MFS transporter permease subunit [Rhodocyclaceae bacterium]
MRSLFPSLSRVRTPEEIHANRYWTAITVTVATMLELLDTSIVNVAIPHMMGTLGATLDEIAWVSTGYVVANVIVLPISGWLGNYFGRRNYFAASILLFTIASLFCGNATSLESLVFWRIVQGLGGGGLISTANATLFEVFTAKEAGKSGAIFGLGIMVGPMLGPTVGGWITDTYSWQWIFYINLPLGALTLLAALMVVPDSRYGKRAESVDWIGILLLAIGIGCLQILLERGEREDWFESWEIIGYVATSVSALLLFVRQELTHPHPIVDLRILKEKQFAIALIFTILLGACLYSTVFVFPVYVQTLLGYTAWETGLVLLPGALASGLTMAVMANVVGKSNIDLRLFMVLGASIFGLSMWQHGQFTVVSGNDDFLWPMIGRGVGLGMIFIPLNNLALGNLKPEQIANGSGLYNLTRQLGGSMGIAATATTLITLQTINRGTLLEHVSINSPETLARLAMLKANFMAHGASATQAAQQALTVLNSLTAKQASMIAFERLFLYFGIGMLAALPLLLLMKRTHFKRPTPSDVH